MKVLLHRNDPEFTEDIENSIIGDIVFYKGKSYILTDYYWDLTRICYQYTYELKPFNLIRFYWFKLRNWYYTQKIKLIKFN